MRRVPFLAALLAVAAAVLVLGPAQLRTGAQTGTPSAAGHGQGFVGSWHIDSETPFGASRSLLTLNADGTVIFSNRPVYPGGAGFAVTFTGTGHGTWEQTGATNAAITFVFFFTDGEGNFVGVASDSIEGSLDPDGASWSGPFSSTTTDPGGNVLFVGGGTVEATRITVQPLATPTAGTAAATPTA